MKKLVMFLQTQHNKANPINDALNLSSRVDAVIFQSNVSDELSNTDSYEILFDQTLEALFEHLAEDIKNLNIRSTLIIPGEDILKCDLKVPAKQFRQIQKALPYLVEDQLASDPDDCFIALGERRDDYLSCAVIQKERLAQYHDFLVDHKLSAEKIVSDDSLLSSDTASLYVFENRVLMSTAQGKTFAFDLALLEVYLAKLQPSEKIEEADKTAETNDEQDAITSADLDGKAFKKEILTINYYAEDPQVLGKLKTQVLANIEHYKKTEGFDVDIVQHEKTIQSYCLESAKNSLDRQKQNSIINFLQGEYKVKRIGARFKLDVNLKPIAYLLVAFVILYLFSMFVETKKYESAAEQAEQKTKSVFQEIFPKTKNYSRMKERVSSLLKGSAEPSDNQFLKLMFVFSEAMQSINSLKANSLQPTQIQYEQDNAELKVDIIALDFDTLNALKEKADSLGLLLEISSTSTEKTGVKGRLKMKLKS